MRLIDADKLDEILKNKTHKLYEFEQGVLKSKGINSQEHTNAYRELCDYVAFEGMVENQPTVEERPKGKWKYEILFPPTSCCSSTRIKCTKCGYSRQRIDGEILNYCPNCGADMKGEKND